MHHNYGSNIQSDSQRSNSKNVACASNIKLEIRQINIIEEDVKEARTTIFKIGIKDINKKAVAKKCKYDHCDYRDIYKQVTNESCSKGILTYMVYYARSSSSHVENDKIGVVAPTFKCSMYIYMGRNRQKRVHVLCHTWYVTNVSDNGGRRKSLHKSKLISSVTLYFHMLY